MASDFPVAWQFLSMRTIGFFVTDPTPRFRLFISGDVFMSSSEMSRVFQLEQELVTVLAIL
jgi:hypothetical protein